MNKIFCYHGTCAQRTDWRLERNLHSIKSFQNHIMLLSKFKTIYPDEIIKSTGKLATLITFDDGYKNNLIAAEILSKYKIPWTLFISTGAIGRDKAIWTVELSLLILHGNAAQIESLNQTWSLKTRKERELAFQSIRYPMKAMPAALRKQTMNDIRAQFPSEETQRLLEQFPSLQMLTWNEVRELSNAGVEIGSHGIDHEIHHENQPEEVRLNELLTSKKEIEKQLGRPCNTFAYPNGNFAGASPEELKKANYKFGFTLQSGVVGKNYNPYLLPRLNPPESFLKFTKTFLFNQSK